ncbi:conjugal transfer protein TraF [uncultured Tateyamaria sp.]|uniref:TlpA family protein disulfide reductase n=1 Tax=uncultured Tateyamaria sp. TaxID=455651 RepID=UPI0026138599|nr:conjugal transfer protein TraF [uncultured Tateyamaria sp.]
MKRRHFLAGIALSGFGLPVAAEEGQGVGIILVGASWCTFCKSAAPVLAAMVEPVGIPVLVASQDARPIPPFPTATDASKHPIASKILTLPTTLIYSQAKDEVTAEIVGYRNARHYAQRVQAAVLSAREV